MKKDLRVKIVSYVIASAIAFINSFGLMFSSVSFAADTSDDDYTIKSAGVTSWDSVSDELVRLGDMYVSSLYGSTPLGSASVISSRYDIPCSWVSTMVDNKTYVENYCIAPVSDVAYYLDSDKLCVYDPNKRTSGTSGGGGKNRYVTSSSDFIFSSDFFKDRIDYWSDYYKPKDNLEQYTYSYQTASVKNGKSKRYSFSPNAPVYTDDGGAKTGWGFKGWSGGVYLLPFLVDDDKNGGMPYYSDMYFFIHSQRSSDGVLQIVLESYNLSDNSLKSTSIKDWDTSRLSLGVNWYVGTTFYLYSYKSYFDYMNGSSPAQITSTSVRYLYTGNVSSLTKVDCSSFLANSAGYDTFTPDTDTRDDYGFIISSSPFDLWINQTDINASKIPDNYYITYGDNVYNYTITNPVTGKGTTINNFITNNYNIPDDGGSSGGDDSGGGTVNNWNISFGDFLIDIGTTIQTAITAVFVPSDVALEGYQTQLTDTINLKLPWINDIGDILNSLFVEIQNGNIYYSSDYYAADSAAVYSSEDISTYDISVMPVGIYPCWTIDIDFFGQSMELTLLDFALYADSLYYVRIVVGAFVYIAWFINLYRFLPKLIGGVGDMTNTVLSVTNKDGED